MCIAIEQTIFGMGILTDPANTQSKTKMRNILTRFKTPICGLLYLAGIVYFCSLADSSRNNATYFSENALLPGKLMHLKLQIKELYELVSRYSLWIRFGVFGNSCRYDQLCNKRVGRAGKRT